MDTMTFGKELYRVARHFTLWLNVSGIIAPNLKLIEWIFDHSELSFMYGQTLIVEKPFLYKIMKQTF